jgi:hypothetical protein
VKITINSKNNEMLQLTNRQKRLGPMDYRCEDRKKIGELRRYTSAVRWVLTPSFRKPLSSSPNNKPFSQEMHLKIPLSSQGLKLSNSKPGCRVSTLHFFVN